MPDPLSTFHDLAPTAKTGMIFGGLAAWVAGLWLLAWVREAFR